jgi:putative copper resistance protein D
MLLFGIGTFQTTLAPEALVRALDGRLRKFSKAAALVVVATTIGWLLLVAGEMGDGWADAWNPSTIGSVLTDTEFGRVWVWRLGFAVALLAALSLSRDHRWPVFALLAALNLGSLGLVGHAAMRAGALGWLNMLSNVLHLLAAGFWLGSLAPLIASLRLTTYQTVRADALVVLWRFSSLGHGAVAIVLATGVLNTWIVLNALPIDVSSPYQTLLLVKIGLVASMLALALVNRYALMPRFRIAPSAVRLLRWNAIGESVLGVSAVGLVSAIGILPPT